MKSMKVKRAKKPTYDEVLGTLEKLTVMMKYPEIYGMRLYYAMEGTKVRESVVQEAEQIILKARGE